MLDHFRPALLRRLAGGLACALAFTLSSPAHALETRPAPAAAPARVASAHRLLRDPEALAGWLAGQSPVVRAARARANQAAADVRSSHLFPNPVLDASVLNIPITTPTIPNVSVADSMAYGVGLSETFELGKRGPRQDAAALRERAARLEVTSTLTDRVTAARDALGAAVHLRLRLETLRESLDDAERAASLEKTRLEQKALSGMDYDRLLLDLAALRAEFAPKPNTPARSRPAAPRSARLATSRGRTRTTSSRRSRSRSARKPTNASALAPICARSSCKRAPRAVTPTSLRTAPSPTSRRTSATSTTASSPRVTT
jgi:outer membrane protein, heavy metal efflux system